jgi:anti-anti-sigma factor
MEVKITKTGDSITAKVIGAVTENDGVNLKHAFDELIRSEGATVTIDLSLVPIITSTGIGKLIVLYRKLKQEQRELVIRGIHDNLYSMFTSINLHKMLTIHRS